MIQILEDKQVNVSSFYNLFQALLSLQLEHLSWKVILYNRRLNDPICEGWLWIILLFVPGENSSESELRPRLCQQHQLLLLQRQL